MKAQPGHALTPTTPLVALSRTQLYAEIKLHKMLDHPNIVGFKDCFDDDENVYMSLELCEKGVSGLSSASQSRTST